MRWVSLVLMELWMGVLLHHSSFLSMFVCVVLWKNNQVYYVNMIMIVSKSMYFVLTEWEWLWAYETRWSPRCLWTQQHRSGWSTSQRHQVICVCVCVSVCIIMCVQYSTYAVNYLCVIFTNFSWECSGSPRPECSSCSSQLWKVCIIMFWLSVRSWRHLL